MLEYSENFELISVCIKDMLLYPLENLTDFDDLKFQVEKIVENIGFLHNQIICQGLSENGDDWHTGIGRISELDYQDESLYRFLNYGLDNTPLGNLIKKYSAFRTRILALDPRHCYTVHKDPTPRIHIPIITNSESWMIWPYNEECKKLKPGTVYWTDTRKPHSFLNGGDDIRIHIVLGVDK